MTDDLLWHTPPVEDLATAASLASALGVRPLTARVLLARGFGEIAAISKFLAPRLADLRSPAGISDLELTLDRLSRALADRETIGVFGDYDVDGVTTAAVLTDALRAMGGRVLVRVAHRDAGYGFGPSIAEQFIADGCRVIVTGDCGTSDFDALALCRQRGVDAIVIDHHQVPGDEHAAFALVNPHRRDDLFAFKGLASCGIAFYIAAALRSRLRAAGVAAAAAWDPRTLLDLVALGTTADLVPLVAENRILVAAGLKELTARRRPGIRALVARAGLEPDATVSAGDIAFRLAPRINAAGRMGAAQLALDVLLAPTEAEAHRAAEALEAQNQERQRVQEEVWTAALTQAEAQQDLPALVVGAEGWHAGVVGIVAARLVDRFGRPAIVIGFRDGVGRGSARTVAGLDLYQALCACREHLVGFGGHANAAGMTVAFAALDRFRDSFCAAVGAASALNAARRVQLDGVAHLSELDLVTAEELTRLGPFGAANQEPLLLFPQVSAAGARVVGKGHLQLTVTRDGASADGIGFGLGAAAPPLGSSLDVVASPEIDSYRGQRRTRLRIRHIVPR